MLLMLGLCCLFAALCHLAYVAAADCFVWFEGGEICGQHLLLMSPQTANWWCSVRRNPAGCC
jgi:hypothetical protein